MVQGQTAQKFFAFDEGDVWRHPGHWKCEQPLSIHFFSLTCHVLDFHLIRYICLCLGNQIDHCAIATINIMELSRQMATMGR